MSGNKVPAIEITPNTALVDEKVDLRLSGFRPSQRITLRAVMDEILEVKARWESYAVFEADPEGRVEIGTQAPIEGTYSEADPMGLFWSMELIKMPRLKRPRFLSEITFTPSTTISLNAEVDGQVVASATLKRLYTSPDVKMYPVTENEMVGRFFYSPSKSPQFGIIVLGGAEGGIEAAQSYAALFAAHGYAALALAYFGLDGLPEKLYDIPLEYFGKAIKWMNSQHTVKKGGVTIFGRSKGGEIALLTGTLHTQIKAIIAHTPSGIVFEGLKSMVKRANKSSWTFKGKEVPYLRFNTSFFRFRMGLMWKSIIRRQLRSDHIYLKSIEDKSDVDRAAIPVEKMNCPILLISAGDDVFWPSSEFSQMIVERLERNNYQHLYKSINFKSAGHQIHFPYLPATVIRFNGGNPKDNAWAASDSWANILAFLEECNKQ